MLRILEMTCADLEAFFKSTYGKGPFLADRLYCEFYKKRNLRPWDAEAIRRSPGLAERVQSEWEIRPGEVIEWFDHEDVVKFVTELCDGHRIETVIISMANHRTVCVSSQVGCRWGCRFCETAKLGYVRDLQVQEIVGQVLAARDRYGQSIRNVVFMGMGEPMDNFDAVRKSVLVLNEQRGLDIALRRITLSTAGVIGGIEKMMTPSMPAVNLAISLNTADKDLRDWLMPINRSNPLADLKRVLGVYTRERGARIMINYVLIPEVNDGLMRARQLIDWLSDLDVRVNLIPLNSGGAGNFKVPVQEDVDAFRRLLIQQGVNVQERHPRGRGMMAGCGQLGAGATNAAFGRQAHESLRTP